MKSVENILGYIQEQFYRFSRGCKRLKCSQLISSSDNKKILLTTRNVRLDSDRYATKYYCVTVGFETQHGQANEILAVSGYFIFYVNLVLSVARVV